eukprot:TRINITY_DN14690_c0_g1_i1.p1 TRINITY_DN14690_c0_g1~~TRINITY_DN14690_c0_g1_i1.p1  ORF type:complete len:202 (-),score=45.27 TRINITY_DN14690_c0_g1_i1:39-608(-)
MAHRSTGAQPWKIVLLGALGSLAALAAAAAGTCWATLQPPASAAPAEIRSLLPQRRAAALAALAVLLPEPAMSLDTQSRTVYFRRMKLPEIFKGRQMLLAAGNVTDEFMETEFKAMVLAMKDFGEANKLWEAPDKGSRRLVEDVREFREALRARDYEQSIAWLEQYRKDIPYGVGMFEWTDDPTDSLID